MPGSLVSCPCFRGSTREIFKRDGTLKSEYIKAQSIIAKMEDDGLFSLLMGGRKQYIVVGEIQRHPVSVSWTASSVRGVHGYHPILSGDARPYWGDPQGRHCRSEVHEGHEARVERGGALQTTLCGGIRIRHPGEQSTGPWRGHQLPLSWRSEPKKRNRTSGTLYISDADLTSALYQVEDRAPRYQAIKEGRETARRCGRCAYCRATRKLTGIINYRDLVEDDG